MKKQKIVIIIVAVLSFILLCNALLLLRFSIKSSKEHEAIGTSFSQVQAERYGSDWRRNYIAILEEIGFKHVRVAAYWDRIERNPGEYDFSELDWMIEQAKQHDAKLTVVVGQKVLRVPECYYPSWLDRHDTTKVANSTNKLIATIADRYKGESTIEKWQLENEFLLKDFGDCPAANLTNGALFRELQTLQQHDSDKRPIVLTQSDQKGFPVIGPFSSDYGFSMYRTVWCGMCKNYFIYPQGGWFNWWKAALINFYTGSRIKIHELQAEAWGPAGNEYLSWEEAQKSMSPQKLADNIAYARSTHIREFDLWGAEWWYWLREHGHPEMWQAVQNTLKPSN